jgi:hypothetical protein
MYTHDGLVKLIHSSTYDSTVDVGMRLIEDHRQLTKSAATIFGCDYADLVPDKNHVGIHLVALGDFEHYGSNRNGDSFPKLACVRFHPTFVKNANVFRHHRNKDPEKRLGVVKASAYNEPMARIELFVHADKEKARDELQRLSTEGDIPFSMACKVAFDRCSVCNTCRKSSADPEQCDHVRTSLGKVAEDGKIVCTHNDEPNFFDISFVGRPADRIAWHLKMASNEIIDSVKLAAAADIWVPDHVAIVSHNAVQKYKYLQKLAEFETLYSRMSQSAPATSTERYFWELRKAANCRMEDGDIEALRRLEPEIALWKLAQAGVIMDVESFYKYAMGLDGGDIAEHIPAVSQAVKGVYTRLLKEGTCQTVCNDNLFDVTVDRYDLLDRSPIQKVASVTFLGSARDHRVIQNTIDNCEIGIDTFEKMSFNVDMTVGKLAEKYAAYKLAAVNAIIEIHGDTDVNALLAMAAAQNLVR